MPQVHALPPVIAVRPWIDPLVEKGGVSPTSAYVEYCWLSVLGPSATWLYRRLGGLVARDREEHRIDLVDLARSVGLGTGLGVSSPMGRSLVRLARFGVVQPDSQGLAVRRALALLGDRQLGKLPPSVQRAHQMLLGE